MTVRPTSISFEKPYDDGSGFEFSVCLRNESDSGVRHINFEDNGDIVCMDIQNLDWLIECLEKIKHEVSD